MTREKRHPIQIVARRTGLTAEVLRVWEKRYNAVTPGRTGTGRRVYSDEDVEHLRLLRQATGLGRRIGDVAHLTRADLETLIREDQRATRVSRVSGEKAAPSPDVAVYRDECLQAIYVLDARKLEAALGRAMVALSSTELIEELLAPMVRSLGEMWEEGRLKPYHEHLATALVRQTLGQILTASKSDPAAPLLLVTTPVGQRHEIGAILAAAAALTSGWRVVYLGPDLPAEDIAQAADQVSAAAVALSIVYPADDPEVARELLELRDRLDDRIQLFVGGTGAPSYLHTLQRIDAKLFVDTSGFRAALNDFKNRS